MNKKRTRSKFGVDQSEKGIKERTSKDYYTGEAIVFDSLLERKYYEEVVVAGVVNGSIEKYKLQQKYKLLPSFKYMGETVREINYISDFDIWYADGRFEVIDTKGKATADAKIKLKLFKSVYPNTIIKWMAFTKATGWVTYQELEKIRRDKKKAKKNENNE